MKKPIYNYGHSFKSSSFIICSDVLVVNQTTDNKYSATITHTSSHLFASASYTPTSPHLGCTLTHPFMPYLYRRPKHAHTSPHQLIRHTHSHLTYGHHRAHIQSHLFRVTPYMYISSNTTHASIPRLFTPFTILTHILTTKTHLHRHTSMVCTLWCQI